MNMMGIGKLNFLRCVRLLGLVPSSRYDLCASLLPSVRNFLIDPLGLKQIHGKIKQKSGHT